MRILVRNSNGMLLDYPYEQCRLSATDDRLQIKVLGSAECLTVMAEDMVRHPEDELRRIADFSATSAGRGTYEVEMARKAVSARSVEAGSAFIVNDGHPEREPKEVPASEPEKDAPTNVPEAPVAEPVPENPVPEKEVPDMGRTPFRTDFTAEWYGGAFTTRGKCTVSPMTREVSDIEAIDSHPEDLPYLSGGWFAHDGVKIPVYAQDAVPDADSFWRRESAWK